MKKILCLSVCCWLLMACESYSQKTVLDPSAFEKEITVGSPQVLDVRTAREYQTGHIRSALQADWNNKAEFKERTAHLDKSRPVLIYCAAGSRSSAAADELLKEGYKVRELKGGMIGWKSAGKPVDQATNEQPISLAEYKVMTNLGQTVLIDFGAEWCPPCRKMEPVLEQLKKDMGDKLKLVKVDAGTQTELMKLVDVEKIPTFIIYKNGAESWRKTGIADLQDLKQNLK
jgi:rhodanese-related sulfurtransferase